MKVIYAYVFAQFNYAKGTMLYGVATIHGKVKKPHFQQTLLERGLWDGIKGSGICIADDMYSSLNELAKEIQKGFINYKEKGFEFEISFDYTDSLTLCFSSERPYSATDNILIRERPLNETEREQFALAFTLLSIVH